MPNPSTNGHRPDDDRRNPTAPERPGLEELITEAEALRTQLAEGPSISKDDPASVVLNQTRPAK